MQKQDELSKVKKDFNEIVKTIDESLGCNYASRHPILVQHLMMMIQREEDRTLSRKINSIN